ncbi:MAG: PaaI family thioesterase [Planctomycetes bacterium]|nr:PaaI family thioesterase [Planctomycetota bacterium]
MNDADQTQLLKAMTRHVPLLDLLEIRATDASKGTATFEMLVDEKHLRTLGLMHGGVTTTLLDTAMGFAAVTTAPQGFYVVTVQLNANFIRPAWESEKLIATGEVQHSGKQTAVVRGEIRTSENVLVATGTGTFLYVPQPKDSDIVEKQPDTV